MIIDSTVVFPEISVVQDRSSDTGKRVASTKPQPRKLSKTELILKTDLKWLA